MSEYRIRYSIIPAGAGPDDYEPGDLQQRAELFAFPDPGPEDTHQLASGATITHGPPLPVVHAAIQERLQPGETPIILSMRAPGETD